MIRLGQYPAPTVTLAHFSDPHLVAGDAPLHGAIDTRGNLELALEQLERSGRKPAAIVFTGDLTDLGEPSAYDTLRQTVEPAAARMGAKVIWVMGNHDVREQYQSRLFDERGSAAPQDRTYDIDGLRIVVLDTSVPGYHHGDISDEQFEWLERTLAEPAPRGTLLAMHHPPVPSAVEVMAILELRQQDRLAATLAGTDLRGILAGHLHYSTHSTFAGVPVSVSSATCYTLDLSGPLHTFTGVAGGQAFGLVDVYEDRIVHSTVPLGDLRQVNGFDEVFLEKIAALSTEERLEAFSSKTSTVTAADSETL